MFYKISREMLRVAQRRFLSIPIGNEGLRWRGRILAPLLNSRDLNTTPHRYNLNEIDTSESNVEFEQVYPEVGKKFRQILTQPISAGTLEEAWELYCRVSRYKKLDHIEMECINLFITELMNINADSWAKRVMRDSHLEGRRLELSTYRHVIKSFARLGLYNDINNLYDDIKITGLVPDVDCFNAILSAFRDNQNRTMINRYLNEMTKENVGMDADTVDILVSLEERQGRLEDAEALYEELSVKIDPTTSARTLRRLTRAFIDVGKIESAKKWYARLMELPKEALDIRADNLGLRLAREEKNVEEMKNIFKRIKPNEKSYYQLIRGLVSCRLYDDALCYFQEYRELNMSSVKVDQSALQALFALNKTEEAMALFEEVKHKGSYIYGETIAGLCRSKNMERAREILKNMEAASIPPDSFMLQVLVKHHILIGEVDFAISYFNKLVALPSPGLTSKFYSALVLGLLNHKHVDEAMNAYLHMRRQNLTFSENDVTHMIKILSKSEKVDLARKLFDDIVDQGLSPSNEAYVALIDGYAYYGDAYNIMLLHLYIKMDVTRDPDMDIWNALMNAYNLADYPLKAVLIWDMLTYMEYPINNKSVSIILDTCSYADFIDRFDAIWYILTKQGFEFDSNNYCSYVEGLARQGFVQTAVDFVTREMREKGIIPSDKTIDTLLNFLIEYNKSSEHRRLVAIHLRDTFPELAPLISKRIATDL